MRQELYLQSRSVSGMFNLENSFTGNNVQFVNLGNKKVKIYLIFFGQGIRLRPDSIRGVAGRRLLTITF